MKPIDEVTNGEHSRRIAALVCTLCGESVTKFRNKISEKEHKITGACQKCQDAMFGKD